MSYRLIDSNEIAIKHPEVNDMDCIYVDLPNGLDNEYHYIDAEPIKHGRWIDAHDTSGHCYQRCSECGTYIEDVFFANDYYVNYCPNCGADMREVGK